MSKDRYSDDHTIEILNAGADFTAKTNQGTIYLTADGSNADVVIHDGTGHNFSMPNKKGYHAGTAATSRQAVLNAFNTMK